MINQIQAKKILTIRILKRFLGFKFLILSLSFACQMSLPIVYADISIDNSKESLKSDFSLISNHLRILPFIASVAESPSSNRGLLTIKPFSIQLSLIAGLNFIRNESRGNLIYQSDLFERKAGYINTGYGKAEDNFPPPFLPNFALMIGVNFLDAFTFQIGGFGGVPFKELVVSDLGVGIKWSISEHFFKYSPLNLAIRGYYGRLSWGTKENHELALSAHLNTLGIDTLLGASLPIPLFGTLEPYMGLGIQFHQSKLNKLDVNSDDYHFQPDFSLNKLNPPHQRHLNILLGVKLGMIGLEYKRLIDTHNKVQSSKLSCSLSVAI